MQVIQFFAATCGTADTALISCSDSANGIFATLGIVLNIMMSLVAILAVCGIVYSGIQYLTARDNEAQVTKSKTRLKSVVIGLATYVVAFSLMEFLIPGGIQNLFLLTSGTSTSSETPVADVAEAHSTSEPTTPTTPTTPTEPTTPTTPTTPTAPETEESEKSEPAAKPQEPAPTPEPEPEQEPEPVKPNNVTSFTIEDKKDTYDNSYRAVTLSSGAIPYVWVPQNSNYSAAMAAAKNSNILVIMNSGTFNFSDLKPNAITIANGQVITGANDTSAMALVFDESGNPGFTNWEPSATANNLVNGTGTYYDIYGVPKTGKIFSAVSNFSPVVFGGVAAEAYKNYDVYGYNAARQIYCKKSDGSSVILSNINNNARGWDFEKSVKVALANNCVFAFNLDGSGSTLTATRNSTNTDFDIYTAGPRNVPTYIVFTSDNQPPNV